MRPDPSKRGNPSAQTPIDLTTGQNRASPCCSTPSAAPLDVMAVPVHGEVKTNIRVRARRGGPRRRGRRAG